MHPTQETLLALIRENPRITFMGMVEEIKKLDAKYTKTRLHYHIKKLEELGFVRVTPVKYRLTKKYKKDA